jgi:hypothetical protein
MGVRIGGHWAWSLRDAVATAIFSSVIACYHKHKKKKVDAVYADADHNPKVRGVPLRIPLEMKFNLSPDGSNAKVKVVNEDVNIPKLVLTVSFV